MKSTITSCELDSQTLFHPQSNCKGKMNGYSFIIPYRGGIGRVAGLMFNYLIIFIFFHLHRRLNFDTPYKPMGYRSLTECVLDLKKNNHLVEISEAVDAHGEVAAIQRRVY